MSTHAFSPFTTMDAQKLFSTLHTSREGLSTEEVRRRQEEHGKNEFHVFETHWWQVLLHQFTSPFIYLLGLSAALAFGLGETIDAIMIAAFIAINTGLGFAQEYHSERSLKRLRRFVVAKTRVRRQGREATVDSRELVPGDIVLVETGDMFHADVRFFEEEGLQVDESVLTGESVPIQKIATQLPGKTSAVFEATNMGFSGTSVVSGSGVGMVVATGGATQVGEVSALTATTESTSSFEKGIARFSTFILWTVIVTLFLVFVANLLIKGFAVNIPDLLIFSIALAVSVIPEALPVVTTLTFSRGALRLAKSKVVVKRLSAVEDLGSIEILCTDKTGTITENNLKVIEVNAENEEACLFDAALGSAQTAKGSTEPTDAFDRAIWDKLSKGEQRRARSISRSHEVPFNPARKWNSLIAGEGKESRLIVRGAPEVVLSLSTLRSERTHKLLAWAASQGTKGRRTLAVATKIAHQKDLPRAEDGGLAFVGLVAFVDPIKSTTRDTVRQARRLGVAIKVLTGDGAEVAGAVAREIGLIEGPHEVMTGEEWEHLPELERHRAAASYAVFARVSPQQKFNIIHTLERDFNVGFLGEGINDAPALKIATVGIVVDTASDIAREAADIVLLRHSLDIIIDGIEEGRQIFANTVKYIKATLASNVGNFLAIAMATFLIDFLPMLPIQILLVNLLSDFPMIAIATDTVDAEELRRPRNYDFREIIQTALIFGIVSTVFDFIFFALFYRISPEVLHTNWFIGSILTELVLIFSIRTHRPFWKAKSASTTLWSLSLLAALATILIPLSSMGSRVFHFLAPTVPSLTLVLALVVVYFVVTETVKLLYYRTAGQVSSR
jgi:Mg2+-importing ATPase